MAEIAITLDGKPIPISEDEVLRLVKERPDSALAKALIAEMTPSDRRKVRVGERLTADQRARMGDDPDEAWTTEALVARWKSSRDPVLIEASADLEIARAVDTFNAESAAGAEVLGVGR